MRFFLISEGAEAKIYKGKIDGIEVIKKTRHRKIYRRKEIDEEIRRRRTKREAVCLYRAIESGIKVPRLIALGKFTIIMTFEKGKLLKDLDEKEKEKWLDKCGSMLAKLHESGIAHGDYTPANIIIGESPCIIDFGLAEITKDIEQMAIDLLLMKRSLKSRHFNIFIKAYKWKRSEEAIKRMKKIEAMGRYQARTLANL
ncbi:MAG: KEOPS complex kinase/ATPase Bud32 [Candidatus Micrarchaeaceae archaeon]